MSAEATVTIDGPTVTVNTPGGKVEVTVANDETAADALNRAGVDVERLGLDLLLGDKRVDANEVHGSDLSDGQALAAPPKQASLGA